MTRGRSTQDIAVAALPRGRGNPIGGIVLMTLALLTAVAPFGIDLYLPAFPAMKAELSTTATGVQLSLTAFLLGAAIGDRKSVVEGRSGLVRVDFGGLRIIKKKKKH